MKLIVSLREEEKSPDENYEVVEGATLRADLRPLASIRLMNSTRCTWVDRVYCCLPRQFCLRSRDGIARVPASLSIHTWNKSIGTRVHTRANPSRSDWNSWSVIKRYSSLSKVRLLPLNDRTKFRSTRSYFAFDSSNHVLLLFSPLSTPFHNLLECEMKVETRTVADVN